MPLAPTVLWKEPVVQIFRVIYAEAMMAVLFVVGL